ncbi:MAG: c-type cytochrome [Saprospiraceae bacterium]|nr:c-type cytochrome [Saprospiraceae bacterium]
MFTMLVMPVFVSAAGQFSSENLYENLGFYLVGGATLIVAIAAFATLLKLLDMVVKSKQGEGAQEQPQPVLSESDPGVESWWQKLYKQATNVVPVSREKEILLDHNYDGIKELDNNLPPWWLAMFYVSIVYGVFYMGYNHFSKYGMSSSEEYAQEMAQAEASVNAYLAGQANTVDENTVVALTDEEALSNGKFIYQLNCVVCHLESGAGLVGPNLTDEYWIHGGDIKDIFRTIKYGVPEKGMIAWGTQLRPLEMQNVASYILTLVGTNPPNPKAPEGEKYAPDGQESM